MFLFIENETAISIMSHDLDILVSASRVNLPIDIGTCLLVNFPRSLLLLLHVPHQQALPPWT